MCLYVPLNCSRVLAGNSLLIWILCSRDCCCYDQLHDSGIADQETPSMVLRAFSFLLRRFWVMRPRKLDLAAMSAAAGAASIAEAAAAGSAVFALKVPPVLAVSPAVGPVSLRAVRIGSR